MVAKSDEKVNIYVKKIDFVCPTKFKFLNHIKINFVNGCELLKAHNFC